MTKLAMGDEYAEHICRAYGLDPTKIQRVIVDARVGSILKIYIQAVGTEDLLKFEPPGIADAEITVVGA